MRAYQLQKIFIIIIISLSISSCNKNNDEAIQTFLDQNYSQVDSLLGEWTWINTHGGWVRTVLTPETEGYTKDIVFQSDGKYFEYIDDNLDVETYFRIDTIYDIAYDRFYEISYYKEKPSQSFAFYTEADTTSLFIFDECRDCVGSHIYRRK